MGEAYLDWQKKSGGIKLNDVIEEFKYVAAGKAVKAGDLVNYINGVAGNVDYGESVDTQLSTQTNSGATISAVALDESRIFIAHSYSGNKYLYGMVVTIDKATIIQGTDTQLSEDRNSGGSISVCLLGNGNVFIAHSRNANDTDISVSTLYGMVVSISGTTITKETYKRLSSTNGSGRSISACLLSSSKVFIAHGYETTPMVYGIVVTISGTSISQGTDTKLSSDNAAGYCISICRLSSSKVFIAHSYDAVNYYLYGIVCTISGTTISKGTDTKLNSDTNYIGRFISACTLPNGNVFIAHSYGSDYYLRGMVCSIDGTSITKGTDTPINSSISGTGKITSIVLLPNGDVFIAYPYGTNNRMYGVVVTIDGTKVTKGAETELYKGDLYSSGATTSIVIQDNSSIFVAHSVDLSGTTSERRLYAQLFSIDENNVPTNQIVITEYEQQVTPAIEPPFNAIALSSGVGGTDIEHKDQVKIARPSAGGEA